MAITAFDLSIRTTTHTRNNNQIWTHTWPDISQFVIHNRIRKRRYSMWGISLLCVDWLHLYYIIKRDLKKKTSIKYTQIGKKTERVDYSILSSRSTELFFFLLSDRRWVIRTSLPTHWAQCSRARHHMHLLSHAYFTSRRFIQGKLCWDKYSLFVHLFYNTTVEASKIILFGFVLNFNIGIEPFLQFPINVVHISENCDQAKYNYVFQNETQCVRKLVWLSVNIAFHTRMIIARHSTECKLATGRWHWDHFRMKTIQICIKCNNHHYCIKIVSKIQFQRR